MKARFVLAGLAVAAILFVASASAQPPPLDSLQQCRWLYAETVDGLHLPTPSGVLGLEDHLYDEVPRDGYEPPEGSFPVDGLVGMGGGETTYKLDNGWTKDPGAFHPHPSDLAEEYYMNMRWPDGVDWMPTRVDGGKPKVTDAATYAKYGHKKVLIVAPSTKRGVVASIEESGPALWTERDAGAPPEVFVGLGLFPRGDGEHDPVHYVLEYHWADQDAPLGPCSMTTAYATPTTPAAASCRDSFDCPAGWGCIVGTYGNTCQPMNGAAAAPAGASIPLSPLAGLVALCGAILLIHWRRKGR
jgi:hypothetical protein